MPRVKRGTTVKQRHKKMLALTKGYRHGRSKLYRRAKEAVLKAGQFAYRDRRVKKRQFRSGWIMRINSAVRPHDLTYGQFIHGLNKAQIELDRKVLSQMVIEEPEEFAKIVEKVKQSLN